MSELLERFADTSFIDALVSLAPAVGWGFILGICVALVAWCVGFVIRLGKLDL